MLIEAVGGPYKVLQPEQEKERICGADCDTGRCACMDPVTRSDELSRHIDRERWGAGAARHIDVHVAPIEITFER